ncbi:hypothetical protein ACJ73_04663, partial [Blastomyces percursus]
MPNANHGMRSPPSTSSDAKGGDNTSQQDEIIENFEQMSAILETIETWRKEQYDADLRASVKENQDVAHNISVS